MGEVNKVGTALQGALLELARAARHPDALRVHCKDVNRPGFAGGSNS